MKLLCLLLYLSTWMAEADRYEHLRICRGDAIARHYPCINCRGPDPRRTFPCAVRSWVDGPQFAYTHERNCTQWTFRN